MCQEKNPELREADAFGESLEGMFVREVDGGCWEESMKREGERANASSNLASTEKHSIQQNFEDQDLEPRQNTAPHGFDHSVAPVKKNNLVEDPGVSYEQKQLLELERKQNELRLRLMKMQNEMGQSERDLNENLEESIKVGTTKLENIQKEQEEVIKSIVLKSAVFENDFREYDPAKADGTLKEGAYKEEFIQSIMNKSGVFVKEFREIADPYTREEFIMSIHLAEAKFEQLPPEEKQLDVFFKTIKKSESHQSKTPKKAPKELSQPARPKQEPVTKDRKKKLVYELEVKQKMRQIKTKNMKK